VTLVIRAIQDAYLRMAQRATTRGLRSWYLQASSAAGGMLDCRHKAEYALARDAAMPSWRKLIAEAGNDEQTS